MCLANPGGRGKRRLSRLAPAARRGLCILGTARCRILPSTEAPKEGKVIAPGPAESREGKGSYRPTTGQEKFFGVADALARLFLFRDRADLSFLEAKKEPRWVGGNDPGRKIFIGQKTFFKGSGQLQRQRQRRG
jgi:hypothetical protein